MYDSVLNRVELPETKIEKDLGIMISNDLKWSSQVSLRLVKLIKC